MMTLGTVDVVKHGDDYTIYVDIDDSGWAYIKQSDDWIAFPVKQAEEVIKALQRLTV